MKINAITLFFYCLTILGPFVDAVTGYLVLGRILEEGGIYSPSQLFRLLLLLVLAVTLVKKQKGMPILVSIFFYALLLEFISFSFHNSGKGFALGIIYSTKIVYTLGVYFLTAWTLENKVLTEKNITKLITSGGIITASILTLSFLMGIGYNTYAEGTFGFKGPFSAGNGLGVFLGVCLGVYINKIKTPSWNDLFPLSVMFFSTVIIGTKAALFLTFLSLIFLLYKSRLKLVIVPVVVIIGGYYFETLSNVFFKVFDVIIFRFGKAENLLEYVLSNRDTYLADAFKSWNVEGFNALRVFFGSGVYISFRSLGSLDGRYDTLESDLWDIFFMYGLISTILYIISILWIIIKSYKKQLSITFYLISFMCIHSLMAGHMLFNGMTGALFAMVVAVNTKRKSIN